jgi:hypothetical protein
MLKSEEENNKDKNKSSFWDMSKKSFESPFSKSKKSIPASNNPNKRFLLLELFNKKIKEDMSNEWKKDLADSLKKYSEIIQKRSSGVADFVLLSSRAMDIFQEAINAENIEQDNENDENNQL